MKTKLIGLLFGITLFSGCATEIAYHNPHYYSPSPIIIVEPYPRFYYGPMFYHGPRFHRH